MNILSTTILPFLLATGAHAAPFIVAHRGASHDAPENTLPAFELAWKQGADAIEGDFHLTADGKII
jgi:glycerophosphoryl diester phosphodiesterase